jgi:flagellar basal-body rod protein FlgC
MYEPGHPHADENGMVSYPAIDSTQEMMTVMAALRAYEANLSALQVTRMLAAKALEIGGA